MKSEDEFEETFLMLMILRRRKKRKKMLAGQNVTIFNEVKVFGNFVPRINPNVFFFISSESFIIKTRIVKKQPPSLCSEISVLFFQEHLFLDFSKRLNVFTEQIPIFQQGLSVRRTDTIFPRAMFMCSPNRY